MNSDVRALAMSGSDLYVGGSFTAAGGKVSAYLARAALPWPALTLGQAGGWLELTWPESHRGWELEMQTNRDGVGSGAEWYPVPGSKTNTHMSLPIDPAMPSVFYRLRFQHQP